MADVNANIGINFDTSQALAQLRQLQAGLSRFNQTLTQGNVAAMQAQKGLNDQLMQAINATGKFVATQKEVATSTSSFTKALEKNQLSMREYFRYTVAAATANTKTFKGMFAQEREIINRARKDRVKLLQSQYIQMQAANGDMIKVLQVIPKHLQMAGGKYTDYATRMQMAAQRQQFLNQLLKQGSTQLLNFGKNTQWAGRQLMVGLTIPLSILGSTAAKTFMEMEEAVLKFTRVYGDMTTSGDATNKAVADIQRLGKEFTKYGIAVKDTMEMAATAAAMGLQGDDLQAQVINATKLSVLGQVEQQQALETTISLQNAFGISAEQLAQKINFLNAVENQTVLSIEDLTIAIPKAGPVVKQLGGSVEDLAFFMTAMKEGGINASEGANALKSGLASIINPAKKTSQFLADLGINIKGIVDSNAGNLKGTVVGVARALDTLDPLNRARAIEQLFGKFQFSRISTLFQNIVKDGTQASRALDLAGASVEELAILSERELKKVEDSTGAKFKKAMENLKTQLVPVGKAFLQAVTPIVAFAGKILEKFNGLGEGTKKVITIMIGVIGGLAPIALMTFGILANGVANLIKFFALLRGGIAKLNGSNNVLGGGFDYLTNQQIENLAETNALHTSHSQLISTFNVEKSAVDSLAAAYGNASSQARALAQSSPGLFNTVPGPAGAVAGLPKKFAQGGVVPGTGNKDTVPSMLTPGEVVLTKQTVKDNPELVSGLLNGTIKQYNQSTNIEGGGFKPTGATGISNVEKMMAMDIQNFAEEIGKLSKGKSQQTTIAEVKLELTKATERAGEDIANGIKKMLAEAAQSVEKTTASWVKDKVRETNPATGKQFREPYSSKASTEGFVFAHGARNANDRGEAITDPKELARLAELTGDTTEGIGRLFTLAEKNGGSAFGLSNFGFMMPEEANKKKKGGEGEFVMPKDQVANLFTGSSAATTLSPVLEEWARIQGITLENAITDPARAAELNGVIERYGSSIAEEINSIPGKFDEEAFYSAVERANGRISEADTMLRTAVDNLLVESNFSITTKDPKAKVVRSAVPQNATAMRQDLGLPTETILPDGKKIKPMSGYGSKNDKYLEIGSKIDQARADGSLIGAAVIDGIRSESGTAADSPSRKAIQAGKEVVDGLAIGMQDQEGKIRSQSSELGSSTIPTSAQTQSKVDKMDLGNKSFYDDIDTPEMRDQRQILKSQDRQRRKLGAKATVDSVSSTSLKTAEETEKSSAIIAEQTEELANITEEAVVAQTGNTNSILSGAEITNATTNNLGEVLQATDKTGIAQQDLAKSSANIAEINDQIEREKKAELERLKRYNAEQAAQQAAESGIIPPGTQSGSEYVNPATAMGSVEAYDEASTYTRDKNGSILFDPETGQPTTLTQSQLKKKKRGMRKEKVGRVSGKAAGALGTAAMVAGMAGAPPQVTAALGGAATVAQFAPMIAGMTGPQGIVAALAAVAAGAYLFNKHLNKMAEKAAQFAKDLSATREGLKAIGEVTGKVGASEIMDKRRQSSQYGKYDEAVKIDNTFGESFLGSEPGKKEKKLFQENIKQFGSDKAVSDLALKLATGVADGVLDSDQANSIAANLAIELKDAKLEMQVIGQIQSLIGPDGKDLKDSPMEARINIMAKAQSRSRKLEEEIAGKAGFGESSRKEVAALAALNMNNLELVSMMADQVQVEYETQKKKLEAEKASTTNAAEKLKISEKISQLDAQNLKDTMFMNDQIAAQINKNAISFNKVYSGSVLGKQAMREDAFFDASRSQVESTYKGTDQEDAAKKFLNKTERLSSDTTTGKYNDKTGEYVKTGLGTAQNAQRFQAKMEMLVGSKVLSPAEATAYMDLFSGKLNEMDFLLNTSIQTRGAGKTKELFGIFAGFSAGGRKKATSIITDIIMTKKDPAEFDSIMESLKSIQVLDGNTIDFEIMVKAIGLEGIERIKKEQEAIEKLKEDAKKAGKDSLVSADGKSIDPGADVSANMKAAVDALELDKERMAEFQAGSLEQQAEYLQKLAAQFAYEATVNDKSRQADIEYLAGQQAMREAYLQNIAYGTDKYKEILAKNVAALKLLNDGEFAVRKLKFTSAKGVDAKIPGVGDTPGAGDKKNPLEFLEELAMRIKNVRDGAFDATQPLKSMLAALNSKKAKKDISRIMDMFDGLQQRMLKMKVPKEFRDMIMGMSAEDFKELANLKKEKAIFKFKKGKDGKELPRTKANIEGLTRTGDGLMRFYREAQVGEAQLVNKETVSDIADQEKAFKMLMASGLSASDALKEVQNTALASAIAAGTLGKTGSKEMKQYADDLKKANSELARFELRQRMITANEEFKLLEQMPKLMTAMKGAGMSADQMAAALEDPELAKHLIEDLKDGKVDAKEIADYLNSIEAKKIIDIQVKYNAGKYGEAAQPGIDAGERLFAALEAGIRNGVEGFSSAQNKIDVATIEKNNKLIAKAELEAAGYRHQIELINREIRGMERDIEMNYTRPIEEASEAISDMERELEVNPIFGNRAIGKLNDENTKLSNDLAIMANQAEKINERYDKQAEALQKVADINDGIIAQQQSQLDLADALTQGDIAAAARAMQASRADQASRNQTGVMDALEQARTNELEGLRGAESGLSQLQIAERQFVISQEIYKMENNPERLKIMKDILDLQDKIYNFEEGREAALLKIRDKEDAIYKINKEQLWPLEDKIADMQHQNDLAQRRLDIDVADLKVLGLSRSEFEKIKAEIELSEVAAQKLTAAFGGMLAAIEAIRAKWAEVIAGIKAAQDAAAAQAVAAGIKANADADAAEVAADADAAAADPVAARKAAADAYAAAVAKGDMDAAAKAAAQVGPSALASKESGSIGAASIASALAAAQARLSGKATPTPAPKATTTPTPKPKPTPAPTPKPVAAKSADAARAAAAEAARVAAAKKSSKFSMPAGIGKGYSTGGLVKYFTMGGFAKGTDTVPAMLTPGEFVMSRYAVQSYGLDKMKSINNGTSVGDSVYNYSINVNVESEANPDEIARVVMTQIRSIDSQKLRGTRI